MANSEHLAMLEQGIEIWNEWRRANYPIKPNFNEVGSISDLVRSKINENEQVDLCGVNFSGANLRGANLRGADLSIADLSKANLSRADLRLANLRGTNLSGANLSGANLSRVDFFSKVNFFSGVNFSGTNLSRANLSGVDFSGVNFSGANLSKTNLSRANLSKTNLSGANLSGTNLSGVDCSGVDFSGVDCSGVDFSGANLSGVNFSRANLSGVNFHEANLTRANLSRTNLSGVNFGKVNLSKAYLRDTNRRGAYLRGAILEQAILTGIQALATNFGNATLTGACIKDWNINTETNLQDVICDYIYLKENLQERRPHDPNKNFAPGEFTKLFQKALETVDLIFSDGINWQAFLTSFQKLQVECGSGELAIQAIEKKSDNAFVVRVEAPLNANKAEVEKYLKREYKNQLKAIEDKYRLELNAKDKEIEIYKEKSADILELAKLAASRPINISQIQGNNMAGDRNIHMGSGNYNERIEGDYVQGNKFDGNKQNLAQAASEIQALLKQLEETYPTNSTANQMVVAAKAVEQIESNPTLKQKAISAVKEGGIAAFEKAIDNPAGAFIAGAVKGWQEAK